MDAFRREDERLRRIYCQHSWVHTHMDNGRVKNVVSYVLPTAFPDVQPADGSDRWNRLLFNPKSPLRSWSSSLPGKPGGVAPQGLEKKGMVRISWLMS